MTLRQSWHLQSHRECSARLCVVIGAPQEGTRWPVRNVANARCCHKLFRPDPRNRHHQRYCAAPRCRAASEAASQARWLAAPKNRDYFRDPVHVARVREWRSRNSGYWRKRRPTPVALQDLSLEQGVDSTNKKASFAGPA